MTAITAEKSETPPQQKVRKFGLVGIIVAFLGLAGAIFAPLAFEVKRPPPQHWSDVLADTAVKIKDRVTGTKAPPPPPRTDWRVVAIITASAFGFVGVALGAASWVRREDLRVSSAALAIGLTAIGFHYVMAAVGIAIVLLIVAWLMSHFG